MSSGHGADTLAAATNINGARKVALMQEATRFGAGRATALVGERVADAASLLTLVRALLAGVVGCASWFIWAGGNRLVRCCEGSLYLLVSSCV